MVLLLLYCFTHHVHAQEWIGGTGDWDDPNNWDTGTVPGNDDDVLISNGGTVIINGTSRAVYSVTLEDGSIAGSEELSMHEFYWYGGSITGSGIMEVTDYMRIDALNPISLGGRTLTLLGDCAWYSGDIDILSSGTFNITDGAIFTAQHGGSQTIGDGGGKLLLDLGGNFENKSCATAINGELEVQSGSITILNSTLTIAGSSSHILDQCNINIGTNSKFLVTDGTVAMEAGTSASGNGTLEINGGSVNFNGNNPISTKVNLINGGIGGSSNPNFSAPFTWSGGELNASGTVTVSNLTINTTSNKNINGGTVLLTSSGTWSGGDITLSNGANFQTGIGSNFTISHSSSQVITSSGAGGLTFSGAVTKSSASITQIDCNINITSSGSLKVDAGTFQTLGGSVGSYHSGIRVGPGATFNVAGGVHELTTGTIYGAGSFLLSGGSMTCAIGTKLITSLFISEGILSNLTNLAPPVFEMTGGTLETTGNVTVSVEMVWASGFIGGAGSVIVNGNSSWEAGGRTLDVATIMLYGDTEWSGGDFIFTNECTIHSTAGTNLMITHTGIQSAVGSGHFQVDGTLEKYDLNSTTNIDVDFMHNGMMEGDGTITFGTFTNHGNVSPGFSIGQLIFNDFNNVDATLDVEIVSTGARGVNYDAFDITGGGVFGGNLHVSLLNGFIPSIGASFEVINCNNCTGTFTNLVIPTLPPDRNWAFDYSTGLTITVEQLLPVDLTLFNAKNENGKALLDWATESETNNKGFFIERKHGISDWMDIGFVEGSVNSFQTLRYSFVDEKPLAGMNYYRLRQIDLDGVYDYSVIRTVFFERSGGLEADIFPNPISHENLKVRFLTESENEGTIAIFDSQGKRFFEQKFKGTSANEIIELDNVKLSTGLYMVIIQCPNESNEFKLVVK